VFVFEVRGVPGRPARRCVGYASGEGSVAESAVGGGASVDNVVLQWVPSVDRPVF
jgi:hypothetical protein